MTSSPGSGPRKHAGSCHCGAVRFEVELDLSQGATRCNCSVCTKIATTSAVVKPAALVVHAGEEQLCAYEWGGRVARRFFCRTCGIHCFERVHIPQLGGDYAGINLNCLDDVEVQQLSVRHWDGRHDNWQAGLRDTPWPIFAAGERSQR